MLAQPSVPHAITILDGKQVHVARRKLGESIGWAFRSQLAPFRRLAATIRDQPSAR